MIPNSTVITIKTHVIKVSPFIHHDIKALILFSATSLKTKMNKFSSEPPRNMPINKLFAIWVVQRFSGNLR